MATPGHGADLAGAGGAERTADDRDYRVAARRYRRDDVDPAGGRRGLPHSGAVVGTSSSATAGADARSRRTAYKYIAIMQSRPVALPANRPQTAPRRPAAVAPITRPVNETAENTTYCAKSSLARCIARIAAVNGTWIR